MIHFVQSSKLYELTLINLDSCFDTNKITQGGNKTVRIIKEDFVRKLFKSSFHIDENKS